MSDLIIKHLSDYCVVAFNAMASPCELLIDSDDILVAQRLGQIAQEEALRVESKFSRYRGNNIIHRINHSNGNPIEVDAETADLLDYAERCYQISDGLFDITSGILRQAWRFNGSENIPTQEQIDALLDHIGWEKLTWRRPVLTMQPGMEIDLGGIGKEYAVDRTVNLLKQTSSINCLVNFGGDVAVTGPRQSGKSWTVGVENPGSNQHLTPSGMVIQLMEGAVATSGDARRYLLKNGIRYSHILNPKTGWAMTDAPRSVTVTAATCTEAGILSTLALLQGAEAEQFLKQLDVQYWCEW